MRRSTIYRAGLSGTALSIALVAAMPAAAQETEVTVEEASVSTNSGGIDVIVVTAQRKAESLQDAAIAINAVSGGDLVAQGVVNAVDINKVAPSISISNGGGSNTTIFLRGVGAITNNNYLDPAVTPSYDGVVMGRSSGAFSAAFYDLARVEVLKGPQGILYGRNATGGAVNIIPNLPSLSGNEGGFTISVGNYDTVNAEGFVNLSVSENSALRISGTSQLHDAYNRDGSDDLNRKGLRAQYLIEPSDNIRVRLAADYTVVKGVGSGASYLGNYVSDGAGGYNYISADFDESEGMNTDAANAYRNTVLGSPGFGFLQDMQAQQSVDFEYWGVNAEVNIDTSIGELTFIPAYRSSSGSSYFYGPAFNTAFNDEAIDQFSFEARLAGDVGIVDYILGGFYFKEDIGFAGIFNQEFVLPIQSYDTSTKSWAGFGQLTFNFTDSLRLKTGARYTKDTKRMDGIINNFITFCGGPPPALITPPGSFANGCAAPGGLPRFPNTVTVDDTISWLADNGWIAAGTTATATPQYFPLLNGVGGIVKTYSPVNDGGSYDKITWKVSGEYDFTPDNLLYATVETGYRAGGFQLAEGNPFYNPEYITAYSIGSKNRFLDDRLQVNLEAFYWKYKDQQISYFSADLESGTLINRTANAGRANIKGIDVDIIAKPMKYTTLSAQVQYLDTKYDDLHLYTAAPRDNINCPFTYTGETAGGAPVKDFDCSGNELLYSPKWAINFGAEQIIPLGSDVELIG